MNDALVLFMPSGRRGRFALGTTVLDAARSLGVYVESVCGGRGLCGRCQVEPAEGVFAKHGVTSRAANLAPADAAEAPYRGTGRLRDGRRLSCAARVLGDVVIDVPAEFAVNAQVVRKRAETRAIDPAPAVRLVTVAVPPPDMEHPLGDADRLAEAVGAALDPALLPEVQRVLRAGNWTVTAAVHADGPPTVLALWPGLRLGVYGVAFDVGSTTIAGHLVDLATGRALASAGTTNPQIRFGEDLMSRVSYAMLNPGGAAAMTVAVRQAVAALVARLVTQAGVPDDAVLEAVFVANPVMHHLLLGLDPTELGQAPFALAISGPVRVTAASLGRLGLATGARVYVLPCIAGHVGADAAAVALADGPQHHDEPTLVVDVGTNAELLLGHRSRVLAASLAHRSGLRGRPDLRRPACGTGRDRAGAHRPPHLGAEAAGHRGRCVVRRAGLRRDGGHRNLRLRHHRGGGGDVPGRHRRRRRRHPGTRPPASGPAGPHLVLRAVGGRRAAAGHPGRHPCDPARQGGAVRRGAVAHGPAGGWTGCRG